MVEQAASVDLSGIRLPSIRGAAIRRLVLLAIIVASPLFVIQWGYSSFTLVDALLCIVGVYTLYGFWRNPARRRAAVSRVRSTLLAGAAFAAAAIMSGVNGKLLLRHEFATGRFLSGLSQYAFVMLWTPLILSIFLEREDLGLFVKAICIVNVVPVLCSIIGSLPLSTDFFYTHFYGAGRAVGTLENPNSLATVLVVLLPMLLAIAVADPKKTWRIFGFVAFCFSLLGLFLTFSFGLFLALAATACLNLLWMWRWKRHPNRCHPWRTVFLIVCSLLFVKVSGHYILRHPHAWRLRERLADFDQVEAGRRSILNLGSGLARWKFMKEGVHSLAYGDAILFGHGLKQSAVFSRYQNDIHLIYLLLIVEGGIPLLAAYLFFLVVLFRNSWPLKSDPPLALAIGLGLIAMFLIGWVSPHLYLRCYWFPLLPAFIDWRKQDLSPAVVPNGGELVGAQ